jgi:alkanesulfonate monooxygenase SsuD/methylene tetrahydromethanopterin reductase-like flavin-dependent oxidoreductase (luciferase family)
LIDMITLVGSREKVRERLGVYRDAGVGTMIVSVVSPDVERRTDMVRELAEML